MEDLFPTKTRGALTQGDEGSVAPQAPSTGPASIVPKEFPVPSTQSLCLAPLSVVGRRCCKRFEGDPSHVFFGTIVTHSAPLASGSEVAAETDMETYHDLWSVQYDDGDSENWDVEGVYHGLVLYARLRAQDECHAPVE